MKDQIIQLALESAKLLVPVVGLFLIALIGKGIAWLGAKTKNDTILHLLQQLQVAADTAVNAAEQVVLDKVKGAPPTPEKLVEAKTVAMDMMKTQLGPSTIASVQKNMGLDKAGVERLLSNQIESMVRQKTETPVGGAK